MIKQQSRLHVVPAIMVLGGMALVQMSQLSAQTTGQQSQQATSEQATQLVKDALQLYEDRLQAILKTRFTEEKEFVEEVVLGIRNKEIPKILVDAAWTWARDKRPNTKYPFIYFERVLRLQGERLKIEIPPFDRNIYNDRYGQRSRLRVRR